MTEDAKFSALQIEIESWRFDRPAIEGIRCSQESQQQMQPFFRIGSPENSVAAQFRDGSAVVSREICQPAPFLIADGKSRLMQEHAGTLAGMGFVVDAASDVMHDGGKTEQRQIGRYQAMPSRGQTGESAGDIGNTILMIDRTELTMHPPTHRVVLGRSILAKLQHRVGLHAQ